MAKVCVVLGSVREGRMGLRVANMIMKNLAELGAEPTLLDPLEINPPLLSQPLHFMKVINVLQVIIFTTSEKLENILV